MGINSKSVITFLEKLKLRPAMYFAGEANYDNFATYLAGYLTGLDETLVLKINSWYFSKNNNTPSAILWIYHIKLSAEGKSDHFLKNRLFTEVIEYFQQNDLTATN